MPKNFWKKELIFTRKSLLWLLLSMILLAGLGSFFFVNYVFPRLASIPAFSRVSPRFPVVINKVEEIRIQEGVDTHAIYEKARAATVAILNYPAGVDAQNPGLVSPAVGFGLIVTSDGLIFTTKGFVGSARSNLRVIANSGESYVGQVLAFDPKSELAVIKIPAENLPHISFTSTSELVAGEKLVAVGAALGKFEAPLWLVNNARSPFLPAKFLQVISSEAVFEVLEVFPSLPSDAFGAGLWNRDGRVAGLNSSQGILTAEFLQSSLNNFLAHRQFVRAGLGLHYSPVAPSLAKILTLPKDYGALVLSGPGKPAVIFGSPAHSAGLREGDFIYKLNNKELSEKETFEKIIGEFKAGQEVEISYFRAGESLTAKVVLKSLP